MSLEFHIELTNDSNVYHHKVYVFVVDDANHKVYVLVVHDVLVVQEVQVDLCFLLVPCTLVDLFLQEGLVFQDFHQALYLLLHPYLQVALFHPHHQEDPLLLMVLVFHQHLDYHLVLYLQKVPFLQLAPFRLVDLGFLYRPLVLCLLLVLFGLVVLAYQDFHLSLDFHQVLYLLLHPYLQVALDYLHYQVDLLLLVVRVYHQHLDYRLIPCLQKALFLQESLVCLVDQQLLCPPLGPYLLLDLFPQVVLAFQVFHLLQDSLQVLYLLIDPCLLVALSHLHHQADLSLLMALALHQSLDHHWVPCLQQVPYLLVALFLLVDQQLLYPLLDLYPLMDLFLQEGLFLLDFHFSLDFHQALYLLQDLCLQVALSHPHHQWDLQPLLAQFHHLHLDFHLVLCHQEVPFLQVFHLVPIHQLVLVHLQVLVLQLVLEALEVQVVLEVLN